MRVFGIDPSLAATGLCTELGTSVVKTKGHKDSTTDERHERLVIIRARVTATLAEAGGEAGDLVVIEGPPYTGDPYVWDRAGLWWLLQERCRSLGYLVVDVHPNTLKKYATGNGRADKGAMADAAARRIPDVATQGENNAVDALWLRAMGLDQIGEPLVQLPAEQRKSLERVAWHAATYNRPERTDVP